MKTVLTLAATAALTFAAAETDAQTRRRAPAAQPAPAPAPAPYRLLGPGAAGAGTAPSTPPGAAPAATPQDTPAAPAGSITAAPGAEDQAGTAPTSPVQSAPPAAPATPTVPATGGTAAQPSTPAAPAGEAAADDEADAGLAAPERARAETALRRVLGELAAGAPDYAQMNEATAARVRTQQPQLTPALTQYGAIRTITPLADADGSQRFRVTFANGSAVFVIATDAEGKITALGVES